MSCSVLSSDSCPENRCFDEEVMLSGFARVLDIALLESRGASAAAPVVRQQRPRHDLGQHPLSFLVLVVCEGPSLAA